VKPDRLSSKALILMANMYGMNRSVTSADLAFLAPQVAGSREWALSALKRLQTIGFMENGPRIDNAQSFVLTDAGRGALHEQLPDEELRPLETLYEFDGPQLFVADVLGARRLVMSKDTHGATYLVSTPGPDLLDAVIESRAEVVEGMSCEPCFYLENIEADIYTLSETTGSAEAFREYCGSSAYLEQDVEDV